MSCGNKIVSICYISSLASPLSKTYFCYLRNYSPILFISPVRHSFCYLDCNFHSHSLCPASVSSLKPFLKTLLCSGTALPTSAFHHSLPFLLCPPTRLMPHTSLVHIITMSLNFSHSFSTLSTSPHLHTSYFIRQLSWYGLSFTILFSSLPFYTFFTPSILPALLHPPTNFSRASTKKWCIPPPSPPSKILRT